MIDYLRLTIDDLKKRRDRVCESCRAITAIDAAIDIVLSERIAKLRESQSSLLRKARSILAAAEADLARARDQHTEATR